MVFSSSVFIVLFLPIVLLVYNIPVYRDDIQTKNIVLLFASILFYAWGEPVFVFVIAISVVITWILGILIEKKRNYKGCFLRLGIIYQLAILFCFKYLTFVTNELNNLLNRGKSKISIALPIGISFVTFQMISYLLDVYRGDVRAQRKLANLGLYVMMFPQLVAGPIVRYSFFESQIEKRENSCELFSDGLRRFVIGLGKKVLIADYLAVIADNVFVGIKSDNYGLIIAWIGIIAYTLEIYFDFSGYSDMAIGLGQCFGFHFKENFNYPYVATSVNDFWKRWHISLTDWFRDYVYIPLGGNRCSNKRHIFNILLVWMLTGIWHGANWTFLLWGIVYGLFQLSEKYLYDTRKWPKIIQHIYTLLIICLGWVLFRADNCSHAIQYIRNLLGEYGIWNPDTVYYLKNSMVIIIIAIFCSTPIVKKSMSRIFIRNSFLSITNMIDAIVYVAIFVLAVCVIISGNYSPFIYFNF